MKDLKKAIKNIIKYNYINKAKNAVIHIGYGIDDMYARCVATSIASFCINNPQRNFYIHIISLNLSDKSKSMLEILAKQYNVSINLYEVNEDFFYGLYSDSQYTLPIYFRIFLPLLVQDADKIIYVDSDIICLKNAEEFFNITLEKNIIAAVPDSEIMNNERNKILGLKNHVYFNSGVLIISIKKWNENNIGERFIDALRSNVKKFQFPDQDALNYLLTKKIMYLDERYNYRDIEKYNEKNKDEIVLLHFAAYPKPWHLAWLIAPIANKYTRNIYKFYEEKTPWKYFPLEKPTTDRQIKTYIKVLLIKKDFFKSIKWIVRYLKLKI